MAAMNTSHWHGHFRGDPFSLSFSGSVAHRFSHATHHRRQITAALTEIGQPCPELDMVYFFLTEQASKA